MIIKSVVGIGTDITIISRFSEILNIKSRSYIQRFGQRILHPQEELPQFERLINTSNKKAAKFLGTSWAVKEAVYKSLDPLSQRQFKFNNWYKFNDSNGYPKIKNSTIQKFNEDIELSISHDGDYILVMVIRCEKFDINVK